MPTTQWAFFVIYGTDFSLTWHSFQFPCHPTTGMYPINMFYSVTYTVDCVIVRLVTYQSSKTVTYQAPAFVTGGVGEAETDRDGGRCFQRDHHAGHAAREYIDGDRQVRAPDGLPVALIDDNQIDDCMVDLHLLKGCSDFGRHAADACKPRAASGPPRLRATFRGSKLAMRSATVLRAGAGNFCALHACATSRYRVARLRFCRVRNRFCNRSRMMSSRGSDKRPLPLPPLDCPRARSVTKPEPCRASRIKT